MKKEIPTFKRFYTPSILTSCILVLAFTGCIPVKDLVPSANESGLVEPLDTHGQSTAEVQDIPKKESNTDEGEVTAQLGAAVGENAITNTEIQILKLEDGGYHLTGSLGLDATLKYIDNIWVLDGEVTFPSTGFTLGIAYALPMKTIHFGPKAAQKVEDDLSMAMLNIPIKWPDPTLKQTPNSKTVPLNGRFDLAPELSFTATYITQISPPTPLEATGS